MQCQYWKKGVQCPKEADSVVEGGNVCRGHMSSFTRVRNNERRRESEESDLAVVWKKLGLGFLARTEFGELGIVLSLNDAQALLSYQKGEME